MTTKKDLFLQIVVILSILSYSKCAEITSLPGLNFEINFKQYSGYIELNETSGKSMFYWFVESQNSPSTDPLIVWFNGGPGCSSLLGLFTEHGPFMIGEDGNLEENMYSWNNLANVLYVESPIGVGFSYSNNSQDYNTNDNKTADDNYLFLQLWIQEFPSFSTNKMWISGESYAGVYVPMLVNEILTGSNQQLIDNLEGFTLGNPVLSCPNLKRHSMNMQMNMYYYHGMISLISLNDWNSNNCAEKETARCAEIFLDAQNSIEILDGDNLYTNYCTGNATLNAFEQVPDCYTFTDRLTYYLNRKDVQASIHAFPQIWTECENPNLHYRMEAQNMLNYYSVFFDIAPNLRIMIYSGDIDISTVPHPFTQLCINDMNRPVVQSWKRWTVEGAKTFIPKYTNITAGYVQVFDRLSFATVKGAGHEVPTYQPIFAYNLYERFIINGKDDLSQ